MHKMPRKKRILASFGRQRATARDFSSWRRKRIRKGKASWIRSALYSFNVCHSSLSGEALYFSIPPDIWSSYLSLEFDLRPQVLLCLPSRPVSPPTPGPQAPLLLDSCAAAEKKLASSEANFLSPFTPDSLHRFRVFG